jgi:hypothetical protein
MLKIVFSKEDSIHLIQLINQIILLEEFFKEYWGSISLVETYTLYLLLNKLLIGEIQLWSGVKVLVLNLILIFHNQQHICLLKILSLELWERDTFRFCIIPINDFFRMPRDNRLKLLLNSIAALYPNSK